MPLPVPPNITVDLYRGFDPAHPYPLEGAALTYRGLAGYLRPQMQAGRFGFRARNVYWTHRMDFDLGTDVRDAYQSQLDPARADALGDTLLASDYPLPGQCTAFYVVLVARDRGGDFLRVYLDRLRPSLAGCFEPCTASQGCCVQLCPRNNIPTALTWTWLDPQGTIVHTGGTMTWAADNPGGGQPSGPGWYSTLYGDGFYPTQVCFFCPADGATPYVVVNCGAVLYTGALQAGYTCDPFQADFHLADPYQCCGRHIAQTVRLSQ